MRIIIGLSKLLTTQLRQKISKVRLYILHIITNGFDDAQFNKLRFTGIDHYFKTVTTSESAGYKKPNPEYFYHALQKAGAEKEHSLVIGDGLRTDVAGAINTGLDVLWFNPGRKQVELSYKGLVDFENLSEISSILRLN
jgi:putative hydrolase of the HAD superfamily